MTPEMIGLSLQIVMQFSIFQFSSTLILTFVISCTSPEKFEDITLFSSHNDPRSGDGAFYDKFNGVDKDYKDVDWNTEFVFDRKLTHMKGTLFFLKIIKKD